MFIYNVIYNIIYKIRFSVIHEVKSNLSILRLSFINISS